MTIAPRICLPEKRAGLSVILLLLLSSFCSFAVTTSDANEESSMLLNDHPLADSLWRTTGEKITNIQQIATKLEAANYVLLGEKHDNPVHHMLQSALLRHLARSGKSGHVAFEMIEPRHQSVLDAVNEATAQPRDSQPGMAPPDESFTAQIESLGKALKWEERGWPAWHSYQPILKTAVLYGMKLHAGNPDRDAMMKIGRGAPVPDDMLQNLRWERRYDEQQKESLTDELIDAHCGMLDRDSVSPLIRLQRLKDAHMAKSMRQARQENGIAILIAGNGHIRKDRGVPMFLDADSTILSVAMIEVVRGKMSPSAYPAFDPALYDYVWFTARVDEIDPCEKFRTQLDMMKQRMEKHKSQQ